MVRPHGALAWYTHMLQPKCKLKGFAKRPGAKGAPLPCRLLQEGAKMGFPLLVKAALGGGGKGMKLAMQEDELEVHMRLWTHC